MSGERTIIEVQPGRRIVREYDAKGKLVRVRIEPATRGPSADMPPLAPPAPIARAPRVKAAPEPEPPRVATHGGDPRPAPAPEPVAQPEPIAVESEVEPEPAPVYAPPPEPEPIATPVIEPEPIAIPEPEPEREPEPALEPIPPPAAPSPPPRRGFRVLAAEPARAEPVAQLEEEIEAAVEAAAIEIAEPEPAPDEPPPTAPSPSPRYEIPDLDARVDAALAKRERPAKKRAPLPVPQFEPLKREPWEARLDEALTGR